MATLQELIPDCEVLLALEPEELAYTMLEVAKSQTQNGRFSFGNLRLGQFDVREKAVILAASEAWNWLEVQGFVVPDSGANGANGFRVLSRRGRAMQSKGDFERYRAASEFPKSMLHPSIADKVWLDLARGDLADAVFVAFRTVEEVVRSAGGYGPTEIGVDLMRKAFHEEKGPLTDLSQPVAERIALSHLFAGAIGGYKNPHSHRTVSITDPKEAQEMVLLASHLLRIVDSRK